VLRQLRQESGWSQDAYADRTGYHRNYIGQLERGEKSPSLSALFNFAKSFAMRPSDLLRRVEVLAGKRVKNTDITSRRGL
jgi:transcriptional regulator with XRE-family HTH domain